MQSKYALAMLVVVGAVSATPASAKENCEFLKSRQTRTLGSAKGQDKADVPCGSLQNVLSMLERSNRTGGRRLETDKPFDPVAAQANLDAALRSPDVRARLDALRTVEDANERLAYEAAVLDDEGFYDARNLKLDQIMRAKK